MDVTVKTPYQRFSQGVPDPRALSNVIDDAQDRELRKVRKVKKPQGKHPANDYVPACLNWGL